MLNLLAVANLKEIFKSIENLNYDIQLVYYCYEITISQVIRENSQYCLNKIIKKLIFNLKQFGTNKIKIKKYETDFNWWFSAEQVIAYAILIFYDIHTITINNFLKQFEKEMKLYSVYNAEQRVENLPLKKLLKGE